MRSPGNEGRATVLNLCFHGIGSPARTLEPEEHRYWVDRSRFEEIVDAIRRHPTVRISFDDGNASDAAAALPTLATLGLSATFFVVAERIGQGGSLTKHDLADLVRAGMTVGSHGMRHRTWTTLGAAALDEELVTAPALIGAAAGCEIDQVACPYGAYDRRVLRELKRRRAARVYTVDGGAARADSWLQSRYVVRHDDTPERIESLAREPDGTPGARAVRSLKCAIKRLR